MYGLDPSQVRELIVRPTLVQLGLYSDTACSLVLGTALHESHLVYLKQLGTGPALGLWQMEPATHDDCWTNFLKYRTDLANIVLEIVGIHQKIDASLLISNLAYACAMARIRYYRVRAPLPENEPNGLAAFWKQYYNTPLGAGTVQEAYPHFSVACAMTPASS